MNRRNRFLDHLLARFGRQLTVGNHNLKKELRSVQHLEEEHQIEAKLRVLENYPFLSSGRGKAFNLETQTIAKEFSGLRNWVETLFFMDPESLEKFRFNQRFKKAPFKSKKKHQDRIYDEREFVFKTENNENQEVQELDLCEIMRIGTDPENYYMDYKEKHGYRILLYKQTDILKVSKIYELHKKYDSPKKALSVIQELVALLQRYDKSSESVYILEHLLMRPMPNERYFGLELLTEKQEPWLRTKKWYAKRSLDLMKTALRADQFSYCIKGKTPCTRIFKKKGRKKEIKQSAKFMFKLIEKKNEFGELNYQVGMRYCAFDAYVKFIGTKLYATEKEAIQSIDDWMKSYEKNKRTPVADAPIFKALISPWPKPSDEKAKLSMIKEPKKITLDFDVFSNLLTVVLPKWPSRFQQKGFKNRLEQSLQEEAPAHLWLNILWLGKSKFQRFQKLFGKWWEAYKIDAVDTYLFREKIVNFLMKESARNLAILNPKSPKAKQLVSTKDSSTSENKADGGARS